MGGPELQPAPLLRPGAGAGPQIGSAAASFSPDEKLTPRARNCTLLHPGLLLLAFPRRRSRRGRPPGDTGGAAVNGGALRPLTRPCRPPRSSARFTPPDGLRQATETTQTTRAGPLGPPMRRHRHPGAGNGRRRESCRPGPGTPPGRAGAPPQLRWALARRRGPLSYGPPWRPLAPFRATPPGPRQGACPASGTRWPATRARVALASRTGAVGAAGCCVGARPHRPPVRWWGRWGLGSSPGSAGPLTRPGTCRVLTSFHPPRPATVGGQRRATSAAQHLPALRRRLGRLRGG